ncbi:hypothetical protein C8R47DRAFT_267501 [Mycena vitilis]|nr:hypothetical protein C8R47DRAFT_267501 [Mycena vitilis]
MAPPARPLKRSASVDEQSPPNKAGRSTGPSEGEADVAFFEPSPEAAGDVVADAGQAPKPNSLLEMLRRQAASISSSTWSPYPAITRSIPPPPPANLVARTGVELPLVPGPRIAIPFASLPTLVPPASSVTKAKKTLAAIHPTPVTSSSRKYQNKPSASTPKPAALSGKIFLVSSTSTTETKGKRATNRSKTEQRVAVDARLSSDVLIQSQGSASTTGELGLDLVPARKTHQLKNLDKRREARADPATRAAAQQTKKAAVVALDEPLAKEWSQDIHALADRTHGFWEIVTQFPAPSSPTMLRRLFEFNSIQDHVELLASNDPFWTIFNNLETSTITFLCALARGLREQDIQEALDAGVLRLSPPDDEAPVIGSITYIRVATNDTPLDAARACLVASPADAPWTVLRLLELGMTLADAELCVSEILTPLGHNGAVAPLFDRLKDGLAKVPIAKQWTWSYAGTSSKKQPAGRHKADVRKALSNTLPSRFGGFLRVNPTYQWDCYEITTFHLPHSPGIRSDPVAGTVERFVIGLQGGRGLNSAIGGFYRPFLPDDPLAVIIQGISSSFPAPLYGTQSTPISQQVERFYEDERAFVFHSGKTQIHDDAFKSAVSNSAGVLRSNGHSVPYLRLMKDLTVEEFLEGGKSVWERNAGPGPQLFRHLQCLFEPSLRHGGDLQQAEIALHLGASVDFWRLVTGTPDYWLHCRWMQRLLEQVKPIVLSTWSNGVLAAIALGSLSLVSGGIPLSIDFEVQAGTTPFQLAQYLPPAHGNRNWYPELEDDAYLDAIGGLFITKYGPTAILTLLIPNLHPGVSKYRPRESHLVEAIVVAVSAIERIALGHVKRMHEDGLDPDWADEQHLRQYYTRLRDAVEQEATGRGLRSYLDAVKMQYRARTGISRHLERRLNPSSVTASRATSTAPYVIPGITHTSPLGAARQEQLDRIRAYVSSLADSGFPQQAYKIIPFHLRDDIHTEGFSTWLLSRPPNIRVSCSSRVWGNSEAAHRAALDNQAKFGANKAAHSAGGKATAKIREAEKAVLDVPSTKLRRVLKECADLIKNPPLARRVHPVGSLATASTWRFAFCSTCDEFVVANDNNTTHRCEGGIIVPVKDAYMPNLERITFPHDILNHPDLAALVSHHGDILKPIQIQEIFRRPGNLEKAKAMFSKTDFAALTGAIHVAPASAHPYDDNELHLAMALDVAVSALCLSQCPQRLWPTTATNRSKAWGGSTDTWLDGKRHVVTCEWGHFEILTEWPSSLGPYFDHSCVGTISKRPFAPNTNTRVSGTRVKGGDRDCGTQQSHPIRTVYDLPPEHMRRLIYTHLIAPAQTAQDNEEPDTEEDCST